MDHLLTSIENIDSRSFLQITGILISAITVAITIHKNGQQALRSASQQIYQALELSSIDLFRFECEHPELVAQLWYPETYKFKGRDKIHKQVNQYQLRAYICQMLNLFEMACRFRKSNIFEPEIFGSWTIWMWELCSQSVFQKEWEQDLKWNYVSEFRKIMSAGIRTAKEKGLDERKRYKFFQQVAEAIGDQEFVTNWFAENGRLLVPDTSIP